MQIDGYFNANDEPAIQLDLGTGAIDFLVDTGFAGGLIIPSSLVAGLPLEIEVLSSSEPRLQKRSLRPPTPWRLSGSANGPKLP